MTDHQNIALYSMGQVLLATFLGSPAAGGWLMSTNYRRLGQQELAKNSLWAGILGTLFLMGIGFFLPPDLPAITLSAIALLVMRYWYQRKQAALFQEHMDQGGQKASWWGAAGIGMVTALLIFAWLLAVASIYASLA